ncbi:MAG: asparagine synthase (glutamine-hydrolyzing), partial [Myxococcota bacterium]
GLDALDGMFAFALFDQRHDRLLLMRDRAGKKPLYWSITSDGSLVFASEVKALAPYPGLQLSPDHDRIPELLTYGYIETPHSAFRGVHRLPPATRLIRTGSETPSIHRYWQLDSTSSQFDVPTAKAAVRRAVGDAIGRRLLSDVPLGAFLSGGIDSSIVVAEMAARASSPVKTFCVGFDADPTYDERRHARDIAERFGCEHTELVVSPSPERLMDKLLWHHDEPYGDSSALAVYAVAEATKQHVTVALTGDGGDEVFAGYTRFRGGLLAGAVPTPVAKSTRRVLDRLPEPRGYKNAVALFRRFIEHADRSPDEQLLSWNTFFTGPRLKSLLRPDFVGSEFDPWRIFAAQAEMLQAAREAGRDRLDQILRHNFATYLLDDLLVKTDRMTMAVGLEARSPFLDHRLVELAFRIPSRLKMRFGSLKWLLREAYRDILPSSVLDRKKHGFGVPMADWWSGPLKSMVDDLLVADGARSHAYLHRQEVRRTIEEHRSGQRNHGQRIFLLLQLELWLRKSWAVKPTEARPAALAAS